MSKKIPVCCFIFDLDGTLMYYRDGVYEFLDKIVINTLRDLNFPVFDKEKRMTLWTGKASSNDVLRSWNIPNLDEFWRIFDNYQLPAIEEGIKSGELRLFKDVIPTLKRLKEENFMVAIVTNTPPDITEVKLKGLGIEQYFKCVIALGTELQELAKPNPYGILECIKKLKAPKEQVVYIGDALFDILAAKNAGCYSVLINREHKKFDEKPDFDIDDLRKLFDIFERA